MPGVRWPAAASGLGLRPTAYAVMALAAGTVAAFPDGAPWEAASDPEGCARCHFETATTEDSPALTIAGLPESFEPGMLYRLTLQLTDETLQRAGFLLTLTGNGDAAGSLRAVDARTEAQGAQLRSTEAGSEPLEPGAAEWTVEWLAPAVPNAVVRFDLWANSANDDGSPFGDLTHRRVWTLMAQGGKR